MKKILLASFFIILFCGIHYAQDKNKEMSKNNDSKFVFWDYYKEQYDTTANNSIALTIEKFICKLDDSKIVLDHLTTGHIFRYTDYILLKRKHKETEKNILIVIEGIPNHFKRDVRSLAESALNKANSIREGIKNLKKELNNKNIKNYDIEVHHPSRTKTIYK